MRVDVLWGYVASSILVGTHEDKAVRVYSGRHE